MLKRSSRNSIKPCKFKLSEVDFGCRLISLLYLKQKVVLLHFRFRRKSECFLSWTCHNADSDRSESSSAFLLPPRVPLSPSDNENPYFTKLTREIRKASYLPPQSRSLEKMLSALPIFARQNVQQYPNRSNIVPTAISQFPISNFQKNPIM